MKISKDETRTIPQQEIGFLSLPRARLSLSAETLSDVPSNVIIRSRIKYGNRGTACKGLLMEYSKSTTIHGIRYLYEAHRPFYEKLFWFVLLTISFGFAILLVLKTYWKWQDSPVIIGFDETPVPVYKIPFPTITICPEIKYNHDIFNFKNFSKQIWEEIEEYGAFANKANLTEEEISQLAALLQICEKDVEDRYAKYIPKVFDDNIAKTLIKIGMSKNLTMPFLFWNRLPYLGDDTLSFVVTNEGICIQFNGLHYNDIYRNERFLSYRDDVDVDFSKSFVLEKPLIKITGNWSMDDGYVGQGYHAYPLRTPFAMLRPYSGGNIRNVFLNSPESVPFTSGNYILVSHGKQVVISVLPQYIVTSASLRDLSPDKRQCYFNDERFLRFFRIYSQRNCQVECLANFTLSKCGCVKFWMPKPIDARVCSLPDIACYTLAQEDMEILLQKQTLRKNSDMEKETMCNCMPACNSLEYNVEISNALFDIHKSFISKRIKSEENLIASHILVYFKARQFTAIKRRKSFSVTTLIANCGGIFGLFMGVSGISFIELIYFFSVRLAANISRRRFIQNNMQQAVNGGA